MKESNKDSFLLVTNIAKAYCGDEYIDIDKFRTNGRLDPSKYTPEMMKKFKNRCKPEGGSVGVDYCVNSDWDLCYLKSDSCFHNLFNSYPSGMFVKILDFMNDTDWKYNTPEDIKRIFIDNEKV